MGWRHAWASSGRRIVSGIGLVALGSALAVAWMVVMPMVSAQDGDAVPMVTLSLTDDTDDTQAPVATLSTLGPHADIVRPATLISVKTEPAVDIRTVPGTLHPARASRLAFRVGGPLIDLAVEEGDTVAAGTVLAQIDPRDFELALAELEARRDAARASHRLTDLTYQRRVQLVERGHVSAAELDEAVAERDRAAAEIASLTQQIATARAALGDTQLVAPFAGRIARLDIELQDYVSARTPAITFHDVSAMDLVVDLPERLVLLLPDTRAIHVILSDRPDRSYPAEIREIASEQATETGTFRTTLRLQALDDILPLAGLSGTATFEFANSPSAADAEVLVLSSAVFSGESGGDFVWRVVDDENGDPTVLRHPVTVGGMAGERTRIIGGLADGDRIIAYGVDFLRDGQRVRPLTEPLQIAEGAP